MPFLFVLIWLAGAIAVGLLLARLTMPGENRRVVLLCFAAVAGHSAQSVALLWVWSLLPLGQSLWVVLAASFSIALLAALTGQYTPRCAPKTAWGLGWPDTAVLTALLFVFSLLAHRAFTAGYDYWDAEAMYWHSGITGWLSHGTFPPTHPLEPDDVLRYRFGLHALAAAIVGNVGDAPPRVLAAVLAALTPMMLLSLVGVSLRLRGTPRPGFAASVLALIGGSLLPIYRWGQTALGGAPDYARPTDFVGGFLLTGNALDLLHKNPSLTYGFVMSLAALWAVWEALQREHVGPFAALSAAITLAALGAASEVHFVAVLAASGVAAVVRAASLHHSLSRAWGNAVAAPALFIGGAAIAAYARGGMLAGGALSRESTNSLQIVLNVDHLGQVSAPPASRGPEWLPILDLETQLDSSFLLVAAPVLLIVAWRSRDTYLRLAVTAAAVSAMLWITIYPARAAVDSYRFGQAAVTILMAALPFVSVRASPTFSAARGFLRRWLLPTGFILLVAPHLALSVYLLASPPPGQWLVASRPDVQAGLYLARSPDTRRVLVPLGSSDGGWTRLYGDGPVSVAMRVILGTSRHAVPSGHEDAYYNPAAYLPTYRHASETFDAASLGALKVDWVYVIPSILTPEQSGHLAGARSRGELILAERFGVPDTESERLLLRVEHGVRLGDPEADRP